MRDLLSIGRPSCTICTTYICVTLFLLNLCDVIYEQPPFQLFLQVQQMKAQNREEKMAKAQEREKLQREIAARERAERIQVKIQLNDKDF